VFQPGAALSPNCRCNGLGYLSTLGSTGIQQAGGWVGEGVIPKAGSAAQPGPRLACEQLWLGKRPARCRLFRLPAIYGPGRTSFSKLRDVAAQQPQLIHKTRARCSGTASTSIDIRPRQPAVLGFCPAITGQLPSARSC